MSALRVRLASRNWNRLAIREAIAGYFFILPTLLSFLVFFLIPTISGFGMSFFEWDFFSEPEYVGMENFAELFSDRLFLRTLRNTAIFAVAATSLNVGLGMFIAIGINSIKWRWLKAFLRTSYFIPFVISTVVVALLFGFLLQESTGVVNYYFSRLGIDRIPWLTSSTWAFRSIVLIDVWKHVGFFTLIFLAGLQGIPSELYEAAVVDGAGRRVRLTRITIPLLTPSLFFALIIALIGAFQVFESMYVLTNGGPGDATRTVVMLLYREAFGSFNMGYAASMAVVLFVIILALTVSQVGIGDRWVFYR
ncbi:MAG: sugar ABC transporter permease [Chloroflexi bacterium]|nr:sugar ABC transporter permease [Chloroflexota bacterium]